MIQFFKSVIKSTHSLFPNFRYKFFLVLLISFGALVSVAELGLAKIFTDIVLNGRAANKISISMIILFVLLSLIARLSHYFQRTKRIIVLSESISATSLRYKENSWNHSLAIEIINILTHLLQVLVVLLFLTSLSFSMGLITLGGLMAVLWLQGNLYVNQERFQRQISKAKYKSISVSIETRLFTRIRSAEIGVLFAGIVSIALLVMLVLVHAHGLISSANSIITFFGIRLIATNLNSLSSSTMRFARALVNSSVSTVNVTQSSSNIETLREWREHENSS